MKLAVDAYYAGSKAKVVGVLFENFSDEKPLKIISKVVDGVAPYESGSFYKRELPCIVSLLQDLDVRDISLIVIDGFVYLDGDGRYGLGGHLYERLERRVQIVGVAKSPFKGSCKLVREICRGGSKRPLFVSAIGIGVDEAAWLVKWMSGEFRMPSLLKILDDETKSDF